MDGQCFDQLARTLAGTATRRTTLKGVVGGILAGFVAVDRGAAAGRPCDDHWDCPGNQLCLLDETNENLICQPTTGRYGQICKAPSEHTACYPGSDCCIAPEMRDPPGYVVLTANCCERGVTVCDPDRGCVPVA